MKINQNIWMIILEMNAIHNLNKILNAFEILFSHLLLVEYNKLFYEKQREEDSLEMQFLKYMF